jgi:hypothetical protein
VYNDILGNPLISPILDRIEESAMRYLTLLALLLATPAWSQTTTFRDNMGREIGTATRNGDSTVFRDRSGREVGTAQRSGSGTTVFRDRMGGEVGTSTRR